MQLFSHFELFCKIVSRSAAQRHLRRKFLNDLSVEGRVGHWFAAKLKMAEKNLKREDLFWKAITRKKDFEVNRRELAVRFNTFDLTALGVGSTLGVGVYVLAGEVALTTAGPSVVLSFLVAALASVISGICYAEFGARVPRAGSAYIYAYVTVGELIAFIIGWNLVLEYVIGECVIVYISYSFVNGERFTGSASVARGFSAYLDSLLGNQIIRTFNATSQIPYTGFTAEYFDWLAFTLVITVGAAIAFGLQHSKHMNNFCTLINLSVVSFVIIAGIFFSECRRSLIKCANNVLTIDRLHMQFIPNIGSFIRICQLMRERVVSSLLE